GGQAGFEGEGREIFRAAEEDLAVAGDEIEAAVVVEVGSEELGGVGRSCFRKIRATPGGAFVFVGKAKDLAIVAEKNEIESAIDIGVGSEDRVERGVECGRQGALVILAEAVIRIDVEFAAGID